MSDVVFFWTMAIAGWTILIAIGAAREEKVKAIFDFLAQHKVKATFISYFLFTSAVHAMPSPALTHGSLFYHWFYAFLHALAGGLLQNGGMK